MRHADGVVFLSPPCSQHLQAITIIRTVTYAGAITQQGVNKVAVYKDEAGKARGFKAACPHLVGTESAVC